MAAALWLLPSATTVQVPANPYFGLAASTTIGLFVAGAVPYAVYVPSSTSLATFGWTGLPYRVLVYWGTGSSGFSDGGTQTTPATNVGFQCTDNAQNIGAKLGYGTANDGSLASALQTWPTIVVMIQYPFTSIWGGNQFMSACMIHDAVVADVFKNFNCDPNFIYGTGASLGGTFLEYYIMAQSYWPTRYPVRYAAIATLMAAVSGSGTRQNWPEAIPGENSTNQTFPRLGARVVRNIKVPWIKVNSTADTTNTPATYNFLPNAVRQVWPNTGNPIPAGGTSAGTQSYHGKYFSFYEYTGGSAPNHAPTPDFFYGNNNTVSNGPGGRTLIPTDPWPTWMFQQKLTRAPLRTALNRAYSYAGGSGTPAINPPPELLGLSSLSGLH